MFWFFTKTNQHTTLKRLPAMSVKYQQEKALIQNATERPLTSPNTTQLNDTRGRFKYLTQISKNLTRTRDKNLWL